LATNLVVLNDINPNVTIVPLTFVSASATTGTCSNAVSTSFTVSCTIPSLQSGSTATVTFVLTPTAPTGGTQQKFNGGSVQLMAPNNIVLSQTSVPANMSDFSLIVNPSNFSLPAAGQTAPYTVLLTPHPVYGTNIALSCSGVPTGASCNFTTSPVTLQSTSPATSTLNITTTARPIVTPAASLVTHHFYAVWLCVPGLAFLGLGMGGRRRQRIAGMLLFCALFGLLLLQPACSKGTTTTPVSGTPAGNYTITITATSGSDAKSTTVTLNVP
jgi:hypothetical protein